MEAVRAVALGSSADIDDLLQVLPSETEAAVRRLIFARITSSIDVTDLSITQRMRILRIGLNDEDGLLLLVLFVLDYEHCWQSIFLVAVRSI